MTQQSVEPRTTAEEAGPGSRIPAGRSWLDRYFHISERGSTVAREVRGGVTTFMAMAYILLLNPLHPRAARTSTGHLLSQPGLITATALAAAVTTLLMGFVGKVPLALAAGLSVSGVLASQVAPAMTWPQAMGMCVMYGLVICLLVVTGLRELIMNAIPLAAEARHHHGHRALHRPDRPGTRPGSSARARRPDRPSPSAPTASSPAGPS